MPFEEFPNYPKYEPEKPLLENRDLHMVGEPTEFSYSENISPKDKEAVIKKIEEIGSRVNSELFSPNDLRTLEDFFMRTDDFQEQHLIVEALSGFIYAFNENSIDDRYKLTIPIDAIKKSLQNLLNKPTIPHFLRKKLEFTLKEPFQGTSPEEKRSVLAGMLNEYISEEEYDFGYYSNPFDEPDPTKEQLKRDRLYGFVHQDVRRILNLDLNEELIDVFTPVPFKNYPHTIYL